MPTRRDGPTAGTLALLLAGLMAAPLLAGCLAGPTDGDAGTAGDGAVPDEPHVVAAVIDTGINPYHVQFRDDSPRAHVHPSEYIEGFPANATALHLTFDANNYTEAVLADCEVWSSVEPGQLYWVPGTRIVGAITDDDEDHDCTEDDLPGRILDRGGHGTMTASRLAGATTSLCPDCLIVAVQGFSPEHMVWAADQPWIDLQSNSWGYTPLPYVTDPDSRRMAKEAAAKQPTFVAGGNGLLGFFGVAGHPAYLDNIAGPDGIVMVGGHDNGRYTPWTMTMPHVVGDVWGHPAAPHDSLDGDDTGGGTSGATPFVAGVFARAVLEARRAVGDLGHGVRDGDLVVASGADGAAGGSSTDGGADDAALPAQGPLSDGRLSVSEARVATFHTANPRPVEEPRWDGETCDPTRTAVCAVYVTTPVEWRDVPDDPPAYYFVGYGQVGEGTLGPLLDVLLGKAPLPDRPDADEAYRLDRDVRRFFDDAYPP